MPRRRELRGAAHGLLGAFVSRNNDVGGYWALGKLYKHAEATGVAEVRVDMVRSIITPPNAQFAGMVEYFHQMLSRQLASRALPSDWLSAAEITVQFTGQNDAKEPGDMFECLVSLTDDRGRQHQARASGSCWAHSPFRESRSTRA